MKIPTYVERQHVFQRGGFFGFVGAALLVELGRDCGEHDQRALEDPPGDGLAPAGRAHQHDAVPHQQRAEQLRDLLDLRRPVLHGQLGQRRFGGFLQQTDRQGVRRTVRQRNAQTKRKTDGQSGRRMDAQGVLRSDGRQGDAQTERKTDRQADTHEGKHEQRQTGSQTDGWADEETTKKTGWQ